MLSFVLKPSFSYFKTLHLPVTEAILVDILSEKSSETKNPLNTKKHEALWENAVSDIDNSVANKRFSVGQSEEHFEAPAGPEKLHISTSKKH